MTSRIAQLDALVMDEMLAVALGRALGSAAGHITVRVLPLRLPLGSPARSLRAGAER